MVTPPQQLNPKAIYLALTDPNTFATTIHIVLLSTYGEEIYKEDPLELFMRLEEDFGTKPCEEVENRINAILLATSTDLFYEDPHAFSAICETLSNGDPGIDVLEPLTLPEILWGVFETELNHGPGNMTKAIEKIIQHAVDGEANDDEQDTLGTGDPYDYLTGYLEDQRSSLQGQLEAIGVSGFDLPPIHSPLEAQVEPLLQ